MRTVWTTQTAPIRIACGHGSRRGRVGLVDFRHAVPVILEHVLLPVKPGEEAGFESAFAEAKHDGPELGIQEPTLGRSRTRSTPRAPRGIRQPPASRASRTWTPSSLSGSVNALLNVIVRLA